MPFRACRGPSARLIVDFCDTVIVTQPSPPLPSFPPLNIENNNAKSDSILVGHPFHAAFFLG
jgi:hypothetical protein